MTLDTITRGNFRIDRTNKNLSRPRSESHRSLSTCSSVGIPGARPNNDRGDGMIFQNKPSNPRDLWGVKR